MVGVEVSNHMISVAEEKKIPNAEFITCDLKNLQTDPFCEEKFDMVTTFWAMQVNNSNKGFMYLPRKSK